MLPTNPLQKLPIDAIVANGYQMRVTLNVNTVDIYAKDMADGLVFDPVTVYFDGTTYRLVDGFHRAAAAQVNGETEIVARVIEGDANAALSAALRANAKNGLQRTNADKHKALKAAWENRDKLFKKEDLRGNDGYPSARQLASITGVSKSFAASFVAKCGVSTVDTPAAPCDKTEKVSPAKADATQVTRDHLEERNPAVREMLERHLDRFGVAIPERVYPYLISTGPKYFLRELKSLERELTKAVREGDVALVRLYQSAMLKFGTLENEFSLGAPFCVCRNCLGKSEACGFCGGIGFLTKHQFRQLPRTMREAEIGEFVTEETR